MTGPVASPADALAAVTTTPAKLLGVDDITGSIAVGKLAHLIVATGDIDEDIPQAQQAANFVRRPVPASATGCSRGTSSVTSADST